MGIYMSRVPVPFPPIAGSVSLLPSTINVSTVPVHLSPYPLLNSLDQSVALALSTFPIHWLTVRSFHSVPTDCLSPLALQKSRPLRSVTSSRLLHAVLPVSAASIVISCFNRTIPSYSHDARRSNSLPPSPPNPSGTSVHSPHASRDVCLCWAMGAGLGDHSHHSASQPIPPCASCRGLPR
ncbi:hypothetical protein BCR44DRAFT_1220080 [Catenaria anguillulae PL171]|uniref:Uncharacterized protein n=1 Tax=Catenaria anguillulae PL171 TaxID=765915 RepID=A0A1Y2HZG0_9FUNG|nr:hypothetical protein BCR44DRAFT_1220080 [Catenaria anguillulae PL171]